MKKSTLPTGKKDRDYAKIINVRVSSTSLRSVLTSVASFLAQKAKFSILTVNPEICLRAFDRPDFANVLNGATLLVPDGVGLKYAAGFLDGTKLTILPGRKLFNDLISLSARKNWQVFLLGGRKGAAVKSAEKLKSKYPRLKIEALEGPNLNELAEPVSQRDVVMQNEVVGRINQIKPQLLFVAFGAPKQEIWLYKNLARLDVGGAMTVGGTFSYLAGHSKLPSKRLEKAGLEWLWRLVTEPWRARRIFNAVIIFPWRVFCAKFRQKRV